MQAILQKENSTLRELASEVSADELQGQPFQKTLSEMLEALAAQKDGVALAAPQIGISKRVFVVSEKAYEELDEDGNTISKTGPQIFVNPRIIKRSKKKDWMEEGCLSVRFFFGQTRRARQATVEALDENGVKFTRGGSGLLAQIFQHEIDHLDGILFTDHACDLYELSEQQKEKKTSD